MKFFILVNYFLFAGLSPLLGKENIEKRQQIILVSDIVFVGKLLEGEGDYNWIIPNIVYWGKLNKDRVLRFQLPKKHTQHLVGNLVFVALVDRPNEKGFSSIYSFANKEGLFEIAELGDVKYSMKDLNALMLKLKNLNTKQK